MTLYYNGVDITADVYINRCEHTTYATGRADTLRIRFVDSKNLWDTWGVQRGDRIRYTNGAADTGEMFITDILPENGLYTLFATALPLDADEKKTRAWEDFRFLQIAEDIAGAHGLTVDAYSVTDRVYSYIRQENESDISFFYRLCVLEGCGLAVYDGKLVVYDEQTREQQAATMTIKIGLDGKFRFDDNSASAYGAAEVRAGDFFGRFDVPGAMTSAVLRPAFPIMCASNAEAIRFARGILRNANKGAVSGDFVRKLTTGFAAGSVVNLENVREPSWNGKMFITKTRADYVRGESKIFFRRPLEGY